MDRNVGQRGKGSPSRTVEDWGPTFHSRLPPPKLVSTISVHSNAQGHILSQGQRRQTHCCQDCFSLIRAQLRSRSTTPLLAQKAPQHQTVTMGRGWVQELQCWWGATQPRDYDPGPGSALDLLCDLKLPEQPHWATLYYVSCEGHCCGPCHLRLILLVSSPSSWAL